MKDRPASIFTGAGKWFLVGILSIMLAIGPMLATAYADTNYRVQEGDSLSSIAVRYGVTVDDIVVANNLTSRSTIYVDQILTIPTSGSNPAPTSRNSSGQTTYTVQFGDTLSEIALQFGTTTEALARANGVTNDTIYAGQVLVIVPAGSQAPPASLPSNPPQANPGTYVVQSGDNIIILAARFGVTPEALAAANGISPTGYLYIGQVLTIPGTNPQPAPTATRPPAPTSTPVPQPPAPAPGRPVEYTVQNGDNLSTIAVKFNTTVEALQDLNNLPDNNFLRIGQVLVISKGTTQNNPPPAASQPASVPLGKFGPKWVDIAMDSQTLVAYEGQTPVYTSKVSTGAPRRPTVEGTYRIYAKYRTQNMQGGTGAEYYYLPNVPYVMYFYSAYAIHGATWHNNFGEPVSQGGVHLPEEAARWMFEWAPIGTLVVSHK